LTALTALAVELPTPAAASIRRGPVASLRMPVATSDDDDSLLVNRWSLLMCLGATGLVAARSCRRSGAPVLVRAQRLGIATGSLHRRKIPAHADDRGDPD
jgi:hypothetical protein